VHGTTEPSFPSGHTTGAAVVATTAAYTLVRQGRASARSVVPAAVIVPLAVGVSRGYLDEHWASDVVAGWSIGIGIAMWSAALIEAMARSKRRRHGA
jgi:undecaprenyl-diphosphatase